MNRGVKLACLTAFALLVVFLRIHNIAADPPAWLSWSSGIYSDEGIYASDARSEVLFGHWAPGDFHSAEIAPINHLLLLFAFRNFGVSLVSARAVTVVASLLTIFFFYLALKEQFSQQTAIIGSAILGVSPVFLFYSRLALLEMPTVFLLVLALYLQTKKLPEWLIGLTLAIAVSCKPLAILCCPAFFSDFRSSPKLAIRRLGGLIVGMGTYFVVWQLPHHADLARLNHYYLFHQYLPHSAHQLERNLIRSLWSGSSDGILPYLLKHEPILALFAGAGVVRYLRNSRQELHLYILWLLVPVFAFCLISYEPSRYFLLFWPAITALCAFYLTSLPRRTYLVASSILLLTSVAADITCLSQSTFLVKNAGISIGTSIPKSVTIIGQYAPELGLSNHLITKYVQPGLANTSGTLSSTLVLITDSPYWSSYWNQRTRGHLNLVSSTRIRLPHNQILSQWAEHQ